MFGRQQPERSTSRAPARGTPAARATRIPSALVTCSAAVLLCLPLGGCAVGLRGGHGAAGGAATGGATAGGAASGEVASPAASDGWRSLVAGNSLAGWRGYRSPDVPAAWTVSDGMLTKTVGTRDLITRDEFSNFELEWDWKVATGGNAGVFYRATEEYDHPYWSGTEYQLLDDPNAPDGRSRLTAAGAVYGLYPAPEGVVKAAGEWNTSRIVARGAHIEHWLNGRKLAEYEAGSPEWEAKVRASKFARWPNYGRAKRGHIAIQGDHQGALAIRNMRVRELP